MSPLQIVHELEQARALPPTSPRLLTLDGAVAERPRGFAHDVSTSLIGSGEGEFAVACAAFARWVQFELGWVRVANAEAPIVEGQVVAVEAHTLGLWSLNLSVITDVVREPRRFGFIYTTTRMHVEEGQERFVLSLDEDRSVRYLIEAVSRPRAALARAAYPAARMMQHRFARQSHERMWRAVASAMESAD